MPCLETRRPAIAVDGILPDNRPSPCLNFRYQLQASPVILLLMVTIFILSVTIIVAFIFKKKQNRTLFVIIQP